MKIIKPLTLSLLTRPFEFRRQFWLGVSVIAFIPLGDVPALLPETEMWEMLAEELPEDQPLDAAIPKRLPEVLAAARAFAPGGVPVTALQTGIQVGPLVKTLNVAGDRRFTAGVVSTTTPFTEMKIDWEHAYGGTGFAENEKGKGFKPVVAGRDDIFDAPNILDPQPGEWRVSVGYGAIDQMAPSRLKFAGTHDRNWLEQDFPGFARDIDWRFFNQAPADQILPGRLTGSETYAFKNLHPQKPLLQGALPGMAARLFLVRKSAPAGFEEVALTLTTVWCFPHRERLVLVHHGQARLAEEDGADIARIVIGADAPGEHRAAEHFRAVMARRADDKDGAMYAMRDADLVPEVWLQPEAEEPEAGEDSPMAAVRARQHRNLEAAYAQALANAVAKGVDPGKFPPLPPPEKYKPPRLAELPALAAEARELAEAEKAKAEAMVAEKKAEAAARMAKAGVTPAEIEQKLNAKASGPPAFNAAALRAQIAGKLAAMRASEKTPAEVKARLDLSAQLAVLDAAEQQIRSGYKLAAHTQGPAEPATAERSAEIRRLLHGNRAAAQALYDLHGADLAGLDLSGIDLSGVCLDGANLQGVNFSGAKLVNAVLAHANLQGCVMDNADLTGASLGRANVAGASLRNAVLKNAVFAHADLTGANFAGADMQGADLSDAILAGVNLAGVRAEKLLAMNLSLRGVQASGIVLDGAKFLKCDLSWTDFSGASFEKAVFVECRLIGTVFSKSRLFKAVFVTDCDLSHGSFMEADLREANFREMKLASALLAGADLRRADFSGSDMAGAILANVHADDAKFVASDLNAADLRHGSFARVDFARADLRGADLKNASLYEANMARVKLDEQSGLGGILQTRMRYLPRYTPPVETPG